MKSLLTREPALFGIFVGAVLTCGVQLGLPIDQAAANSITGAIVAGVTWFIRSSVVSPATAVAVAKDAAALAVEKIDERTAGASGVTTAEGRQVIVEAVAEATGAAVPASPPPAEAEAPVPPAPTGPFQ